MALLYFRRLDEDTYTYGYYRLETDLPLNWVLDQLNDYADLENNVVFLGFNEWPGGSTHGYEIIAEPDIPKELLRSVDWRALGI